MGNNSLVFFGNGQVGQGILKFLVHKKDLPEIVVLHKEKDARCFDELKSLAHEAGSEILYADQLSTERGIRLLASLRPQMGISAYYGYIIPPNIMSLFNRGIINLHGSLLPWNRGTNPNVWSIVDDTPAGVSILYIDEGIDTGPILARQEIPKTPVMTGKDLYDLTVEALINLFCEKWDDIRDNKIVPQPQPSHGTFHRRVELNRLKLLDLREEMPVEKLLNILRACTFPPYPAARFSKDGAIYEVFVEIKKASEQ